jgi:translation initiation factor 1
MSRSKKLDLSNSGFSVNPFDDLNLSFSSDVLNASDSEESSLPDQSYPGGLVRVRYEKKGRGGKSVTVFYDFNKEQGEALQDILKQLKKYLATGGIVVDRTMELQGDQRKKAAAWLESNGYKVKGSLN